jgi:branched-chain amino acid transport system ATP-binding protein
VLLVEHDIDRVFQLADHVTVMNEGLVLLDGTVEDARASPKVQEVYIGSGAPRLPRVRARRPLASMRCSPSRMSTPSTARAISSTT